MVKIVMERRYQRACKFCKEKGHTPAHCDLAPVRPPNLPLTETQFRRVKEMQSEGLWVSADVAEELLLSLREVNAAFAYNRYDIYLHYRRSRVMA